jgi:hypothetical protein
MRFTPILFWVFFFGGVRVAHLFSFLCFGLLRSEFVMSVTIFAYKQRLVRLYLQLFVMSYLRYLCLLANNGVQHTKKMYIMLCFCFALIVFVWCLVYPMMPVFLDCPFLIAPSVFSNVYFNQLLIRMLMFC